MTDGLIAEIEAAAGIRVQDVQAVGGGCINNAMHVRMTSGNAFLKWSSRSKSEPGMFAAEADALRVLARVEALRVPAVIYVRDDDTAGNRWLLLEWLEPGHITNAAWEVFGRGLAQLHRASADAFGWHAPNFIGWLPQSNVWHKDWPAFWRDERIMPQAERAATSGAVGVRDHRRMLSLLGHLPELAGAGNDDGPSLLHGDLWRGNVHGLANGDAALIDPASYYGHREVDLAMAALFGGFDARFFDAYEEAWPMQPGKDLRRDLYQLYYLLVHVNLFGASYVAATKALIAKLGF